MIRVKTLKAVVTFATTSDAMAMEDRARRQGIPGRMIPVPSEIDAGCGLAWCVDAEERPALEQALCDYRLAYEAVHETMMY